MADMPGRPDRIGWRDQVAAARASFRSLAAVGGVPALVAPLGCLQGVRSLLSRPVRAEPFLGPAARIGLDGVVFQAEPPALLTIHGNYNPRSWRRCSSPAGRPGCVMCR